MSHMEREAREAPDAVARFLARNDKALVELGARLRKSPPPVIMSSARGSSDNAAGYFKYLTEILLGVPCASVGASVISVYDAPLKLKGGLCLTISQSGKSPDIVALQDAAKKAGALTVALVNTEDSPAANNADICLALNAGTELSVAATKSFIVSLVAGAAITSHWLGDERRIGILKALPDHLAKAAKLEWPEMIKLSAQAESLYVLGRGPSLPVAEEIALKLKETCAIHAEAYSIAEVMHGPLELLGKGFPIFALAPDDQAYSVSQEAFTKIRATGADLVVAGRQGLTFEKTGEPLFDPVTMVQTAYLAIEKVAVGLGRDPDRPRLLKKVTETV
jgi:glucosamine--fructose-6-phosphate aminotransferase (isomerizing)